MKKHRCTKGGGGRGERRGSTSFTPSKDFEKLEHKNAKKHENRESPPDFLTTPSTPLKRI
jgi:hypothetical protein